MTHPGGRPIDSIAPYSKNAKKHPMAQVKQIADSIKEFGFNQPVVVDKEGVIIVGHGRYEAAKLLGLKEVPVIEVDLDSKRAKAYRLADNKLNESDWDMELVIEELKALEDEALVALTGFENDLLVEANEQDDVIPENVPTRAKLGDLWQLGAHRVLCGDSTQQEAVSALMGGAKADMVFTDPPYNMAYTGSATKRREKIENDKIADFDSFITSALAALVKSSKASAPFYVFTCEEEIPAIKNAFTVNGLKPHQVLIWKKHRIGFGGSDYQHTYEPFVYGWRGHKERYMVAQRNLSDVWEFARPAVSEAHPTMKPVELITFAIFNSSKSEDIVLDTFAGGGSTLIACQKTGRISYNVELDPKYVDVILKRWEDYTGLTAQKL